MLYLREGNQEGLLEVWSDTAVDGDKRVAAGFTELEVRRYFHDRAIHAARISVNEMLRDVRPYSSQIRGR